ncbi:glutamate receptor ionotropic, delta-2-like [Ostrea edulis]|uniref:glutamate receptor ionotropic, delta-2-like n=1 Tax=Ostrea edulis TaxID=37623 RepID=UPI0024AE8C56|nr:glutamate receptor ionotropic, delta-2-like [Ostrea edulis]
MFFEIVVIFIFQSDIGQGRYGVGVFYDLSEWSTDDLPNINATTGTVIPYHYSFEGSDVFNITQRVCDLSGNEILGFITFTSCNKGDVINYHAQLLNLPNVLVTKEDEPCITSSSQPTLALLPDCRLMNRAYASVAMHKTWRSVNVLYDEFYDEYCIQDLVDHFSSFSIFSTVIHVSKGSEIEASFSFLNIEKATVIFTVLDVNRTVDLISKANSFGMFARQFYWVMNIDFNILWNTYALQNGHVLTVSTNMGPKTDVRVSSAILTDVISAYGYSLELMLKSNSSYSIGKYDCNDNRPTTGGRHLLQSLVKNLIQGSLGTLAWTLYGAQDSTVYIYSSQTGHNTFTKVATYKYTTGFHADDSRLFKNVFKDFGNRTLRVVSWTSTPFTIRGIRANNQSYYYGFCYDIWDEFAKVFNFRYVSIDSIDGTYGGPTDDGKNGTGMVGMVMRGEADVGIGPFTVTAARETVIDFLTPFQEEGVGIIMRKSDDTTGRMFRMFLPFQPNSWIATAMSIVVTGFILSLVSILSPYTRKSDKPWYKNVWLAFGAFFGQLGGDSTTTSASGRVVLGIWWICTILLLQLYTANLAAYLTIPPAKSPIKNIEQLAASSEYKPLVKTGSNLDFLFKGAKSGVYKQIRDKMDGMPVIKTTEAGYNLVQTGKYAYMTDVSQLRYKILKDCENLLIPEETFHKAGLSFIVRDDAEFKTAFNMHMIRMIEAGLIAKFHSKWWPRVSECDAHNYVKTATELQIDSMAGIFIVYAAFTGLAIIFFMAEIFFFHLIQPCLKDKKSEVTEVKKNNESSDENDSNHSL